MVALPFTKAVTRPFELTVATDSSELVQKTVFVVASAGKTVATSVSAPHSLRLVLENERNTEVTDWVTVTVQTSEEAEPEVAVMSALPALRALTRPLWFTVATDLSLEFQVSVLSVAVLGATVALRLRLEPALRLTSLAERATPVTSTRPEVAAITVRSQEAGLEPSWVMTLMVALPALRALTRPVEPTVATEASLVVQATVLFVALVGRTVAARLAVLPAGIASLP